MGDGGGSITLGNDDVDGGRPAAGPSAGSTKTGIEPSSRVSSSSVGSSSTTWISSTTTSGATTSTGVTGSYSSTYGSYLTTTYGSAITTGTGYSAVTGTGYLSSTGTGYVVATRSTSGAGGAGGMGPEGGTGGVPGDERIIPGECSVEDSTVDVPMTSEDLSLKLIGMWITCGPSLFGTPTDDGIELNGDHTWSKVNVYQGAFIRDQQANGSGTWRIVGSDMGNVLLLDFYAGNSMVLFPSFNIKTPTSVRRLHLVDARNSKNVQFVFNAP